MPLTAFSDEQVWFKTAFLRLLYHMARVSDFTSLMWTSSFGQENAKIKLVSQTQQDLFQFVFSHYTAFSRFHSSEASASSPK